MATPIEEFTDPFAPNPKRDAEWAEFQRKACEMVVEFPEDAGARLDVGNWDAGEIGACTLVLPTLEEAEKWLENNPPENVLPSTDKETET